MQKRSGGDRVEFHAVSKKFVDPLGVSRRDIRAGGTFEHRRRAAPEKRIALVVGNAAYAKSPLATAANDAGLIAQTLQAAGFDVIGARDLDGDTLRKSFRDFINKAEASGPDTVAMVYLAGYGLQLAGENYFVPVNSAINRDTDVPIEALRTGDYIRQLASLPLKAGIVVLDAARQQPFVNGQIASGLALVEADPHMLIAFNAAPGTVAPAEQGPYGVYAQSLAEMIRTGGLPLPEVFNRVRLRVNEASKGAQVPWDSQKVDAAFTFFERGPDAPAAPPPDQVAAIRSKPIRDLGVQDAYAAVLERDTLPAYEDFLAAYPDDPMAKRVRAIAAARREAITWRRTYRADTPNAYWSYLQRYPRGPHAADARRRLAILTAPLEPPPTFDVIDYDVPPPPPEEFIYVDRPVLAFGDPEFDFVAPPPAPVYYLPPPPDDFVILEPPPPPIGLFILPQPIFVPIPIYVQGPALCGAAAEQHHLCQHPQQGRHQQRDQQAAAAGCARRWPDLAPRLADAPAPRDGRAGAGWRHADTAACGGAKGHADPAGQSAGTAERHDQSCREGWLARRGAGRKAERDAAGQCAGRAAFDPAFAEDQRPAGSGCQGRATRASERCGITRGRQSEREACPARAPPGSAAPTAPGAAPGSRPAIGATAPAAPAGQPRPGVSGPARVEPRHPAPPRRQSPPLRLRRNLNCSLNCGEPRRRLRCMWQGRRRRRPASLRHHRRGWPPRRRRGWPRRRRHQGWLHHLRHAMAAPPPPRMAAPPPRMAAPPPRPAPPAAARKCPPGARC